MAFGEKHDRECEEKWGMLCGGNRHLVLRWVLGVFLLMFVFSMGYKMGALSSGTYGFGMHGMRWHNPMMGGYQGYPAGYAPEVIQGGTQQINTAPAGTTSGTVPSTQGYRTAPTPTPYNTLPQGNLAQPPLR